MLAYKLKHPIEIWEKTKGKNALGTVVNSETLVETVLADMQTTMGKVLANDDRVVYSTETTFIIRNYPTVTYSHFVKHGGNIYRIIGLQPLPDGTGQIIKSVMNQ